jgi:arylsulfatase A-like enzyme
MLDDAKAAEAPFFLHLSYAEPDPPHYIPAPYDTLIDPDTVPAPEIGDDRLCAEWLIRAREESRTAEATEADLKKHLAIYYGQIALVNDQMQRFYDAAAERGMLENTWIIYASDHGALIGEKGLFNQSESLYECLLHVPLVIVPPAGARAPRGMSVSGLVDNVDTFPTILGMAGLPVPEYAQGKDLVTWVRDDAGQGLRDCVFAQVGDYHGTLKNTLPTGMAAACRHPGLLQGARTHTCSYVRDPDYGDEAYDLRSDPRELVNLLRGKSVSEPAEVTELRRRVDEWEAECLKLREQLGVVPGHRHFEQGWE